MGQVPNVTWVCCRGKARSPQSPHRSPRRTKRNIPGICFKLPAVALFVLMFVEVEMRKVFGQSKEQKLVEKYALWESGVRGVHGAKESGGVRQRVTTFILYL